MTAFGLNDSEQELIRGVLRRHPEIREARVFGSRAKGDSRPNSDVDIVVWGDICISMIAALAGELDELPLPYRFDVQAYDAISYQPLREHIDRVAKPFYVREIEHSTTGSALLQFRRGDRGVDLLRVPNVSQR